MGVPALDDNMDIKLLSKMLGREFTSEPDYYELLGVKRREPDPAKVNTAKLDVIKRVMEWQTHRDPAVLKSVQEILNTVSLAESTLTDLRMKAAYDAALRLSKPCIETVAPEPPVPTPAERAESGSEVDAPFQDCAATDSISACGSQPILATFSNKYLIGCAVAAAGAVLLAAYLVFLLVGFAISAIKQKPSSAPELKTVRQTAEQEPSKTELAQTETAKKTVDETRKTEAELKKKLAEGKDWGKERISVNEAAKQKAAEERNLKIAEGTKRKTADEAEGRKSEEEERMKKAELAEKESASKSDRMNKALASISEERISSVLKSETNLDASFPMKPTRSVGEVKTPHQEACEQGTGQAVHKGDA